MMSTVMMKNIPFFQNYIKHKYVSKQKFQRRSKKVDDSSISEFGSFYTLIYIPVLRLYEKCYTTVEIFFYSSFGMKSYCTRIHVIYPQRKILDSGQASSPKIHQPTYLYPEEQFLHCCKFEQKNPWYIEETYLLYHFSYKQTFDYTHIYPRRVLKNDIRM